MVVTYHPKLPAFQQITKPHLPILHTSKRVRKVFELPPVIASCCQRSLKDVLVQAALGTRPQELPGNYRCRAPRCKTCPVLQAMDEFSSHTTGQVFKVKFQASCKSPDVIYLITCRRCGLQYVGETGQPLHIQINNHCFNIAHQRTEDSPVAEHFTNGEHS